MKKFFRAAAIVICAAILLFACWQLLLIHREYAEGEQTYEALNERFVSPVEAEDNYGQESLANDGTTDNIVKKEKAPISVDFAQLTAEYPDIIGWLYCPDTAVDYPVVRSEDNTYYIRHLPDGTWNASGTIFLDYRNQVDFSDSNSIIYGHNRRNGAMFAMLPDYADPEYYEEHPVWYLLTPTKNYKLEIFAGHETTSVSEAYEIPLLLEEWKELMQAHIAASDFATEVELEEGNKVVTLSTCVSGRTGVRYVVLAVLREID